MFIALSDRAWPESQNPEALVNKQVKGMNALADTSSGNTASAIDRF